MFKPCFSFKGILTVQFQSRSFPVLQSSIFQGCKRFLRPSASVFFVSRSPRGVEDALFFNTKRPFRNKHRRITHKETITPQKINKSKFSRLMFSGWLFQPNWNILDSQIGSVPPNRDEKKMKPHSIVMFCFRCCVVYFLAISSTSSREIVFFPSLPSHPPFTAPCFLGLVEIQKT